MIVIVQHHVRDFDAWRPVFEDHRSFREQYGCSGHLLYRSMDDPGDVTIVMAVPQPREGRGLRPRPRPEGGHGPWRRRFRAARSMLKDHQEGAADERRSVVRAGSLQHRLIDIAAGPRTRRPTSTVAAAAEKARFNMRRGFLEPKSIDPDEVPDGLVWTRRAM